MNRALATVVVLTIFAQLMTAATACAQNQPIVDNVVELSASTAIVIGDDWQVPLTDAISKEGPVGLLKNADPDKVVLANIELIAWCSKTLLTEPYPLTRNEMLVLGTWQFDGKTDYSIYLLVRDPFEFGPARRIWHVPVLPPPFLSFASSFEKSPSVDEVCAFTQSTNFGNREFNDRMKVGTVTVFEKWTGLKDHLKIGLSDEERQELRKKTEQFKVK